MPGCLTRRWIFKPVMKLEKIKLSGFKSFVDPTVIPITGNLTAIVGPNGCGKSNIIDAVRWVMAKVQPNICAAAIWLM